MDSWEGVTCCPDTRPLYVPGQGCRPAGEGERARLAQRRALLHALVAREAEQQQPQPPSRQLSQQPGSRALQSSSPAHLRYAPVFDEPNGTFPVGCFSGYVTGTALDYARCVIVSLDLRRNHLTGVLNVSEIAVMLPYLQELRLDGNQLTGPVPDALMTQFGRLQTLGIADNHFDYSSTSPLAFRTCSGTDASADAMLQTGTALSSALQQVGLNASPGVLPDDRTSLVCVGMPQRSCSAFGPSYRVAADEARSCLDCQHGSTGPVLAGFLLPAVLLIFALSLGRLLALQPVLLTQWVPALSIYVNYAFSLSTLLRLDFEWPKVRAAPRPHHARATPAPRPRHARTTPAPYTCVRARDTRAAHKTTAARDARARPHGPTKCTCDGTCKCTCTCTRMYVYVCMYPRDTFSP